MSDYKEPDDYDIIISDDISPEEHKVISEYLRAYKAKQAHSRHLDPIPSERAKAKVKAKR